MRAGTIYKVFIQFILFIFIMYALILLIGKAHAGFDSDYYKLKDRFVISLASRLFMEKQVPAGISNEKVKTSTLIYVLGGNQDSLLSRFRKAASLYQQGFAKRILILSRPGITEFSQELGRNYTNDEWAIRELERLNVKKGDIEPVSVQSSFFGTLSEAKDITNIAREKKCNRLILVTSDYHTRRVFASFSRYASENFLEFYVYGSKDAADFQDLLTEFVKLFFYDNLVIPLYSGKGKPVINRF